MTDAMRCLLRYHGLVDGLLLGELSTEEQMELTSVQAALAVYELQDHVQRAMEACQADRHATLMATLSAIEAHINALMREATP